MGTFLTNLQIYSDGSKKCKEKVVTAIKKLMMEEDLDQLVQEGDMSRGLAVLDRGGKWITVYDEALDTQDELEIDRMLVAITKETESYAACIMVHDSDVLVMKLFKDGVLEDIYNSCPDYFDDEELTEEKYIEKYSFLFGDTSKWAPLLEKGVSEKELRKMWDKEYVFVEADILEEITDMFGFGEEALFGYSDLDELKDLTNIDHTLLDLFYFE